MAKVTKYYSFNGQRVALESSDSLGNYQFAYLHSDQLGNIFTTTDTSAKVIGNNRPRYYGYGRERIASLANLPTDYTFTGQKLDNATGLLYYNARYYDPLIGQFVSPDTIVPDMTNVYDYNRYAYGRLNPMRFTDPTGHSVWDALSSAYYMGTDFVLGVSAQIGYNSTSILPGEYNVWYQQAGESTAMVVGRQVGNGVSIAQGIAEVVLHGFLIKCERHEGNRKNR